MSFPLAQTVQHMVYESGATDSHGEPVDTWASPVDVQVYGWAKPISTEPKVTGGRMAVTVDVEVYAPQSWEVSPHDRVVAAGALFEVVGVPEDYNHGPFGWEPGIVVNLQRVEG